MTHFVMGLDVSVKETSVRVVDGAVRRPCRPVRQGRAKD
jgi:hypothetical protein